MPLWLSPRPGKSPERGSRQMESYEPISPPQNYQGMDKQETGVPSSQRREAESEIRCGILIVCLDDSWYPITSVYLIRPCTVCTCIHDQLRCFCFDDYHRQCFFKRVLVIKNIVPVFFLLLKVLRKVSCKL